MKFTPPTLEEIQAYCKERGSNIDPVAFWAHYESNGWMVGKVKMKKWKMAIVTWERNTRSDVSVEVKVSHASHKLYKP